VGFAWEADGDGRDIDPAARYVLDAEHGPRRLLGDVARRETATGRALLDLAADREPCAEDMPGLRRAMRALLLHYLGGRGLKSWELIVALPRGAPVAAQTGDAVSSDSAGDDASVS